MSDEITIQKKGVLDIGFVSIFKSKGEANVGDTGFSVNKYRDSCVGCQVFCDRCDSCDSCDACDCCHGRP